MGTPAALQRPKIKDLKKSSKTKKETRRRSTKSFKVKAELVPPPVITDEMSLVSDHQQQHRRQQQQTPRALLKPSLSTTVESDTSSDCNETPFKRPTHDRYIRGGGYHSHVYKTYEQRWSPAHVDNVIQSWDMTPAQRDKLMDLKERLRDLDHAILNDPHQCVYFLIDESGNVDLAEKFLRKTAKARSTSPYQFDTIVTDYELPDDYDYFPMCILQGMDREGAPISITRTGAADCWGLYRRHGKETLIRHAIYNMELNLRGIWQDEFETNYKRKATQFTVIYDLQGLSMRHMRPGLIPTLGTISRLLQDTYPELIKRVLIVRAPSIFKTIWGIVKHMFDKELRDLMIFATEGDDSNQLLERFIDVNVLPSCIHAEGADGRVARGFEHVVMEGGLIPDEGTYQTPDYVKLGRTKAEEEDYQTRERLRNSSRVMIQPKQCKAVCKGSFELAFLAGNQCKAKIQLDP
ncbi:SEC14-like protein 2 [Seminavis robusta]|uniref:SEC14-like protein 2 n=1 Tax=Seminavis robusta TaxID=568900 RepID=A0A9N8EV40_9STRA|nr:SEC14-like protein 2 [Seminavis robusta]|eukprot:Sro1655_g289010.1 SEC14-like protein 2 (464) ;mRNA; r:17555-19037